MRQTGTLAGCMALTAAVFLLGTFSAFQSELQLGDFVTCCNKECSTGAKGKSCFIEDAIAMYLIRLLKTLSTRQNVCIA